MRPVPNGWREVENYVFNARAFEGINAKTNGIHVIADRTFIDGKEWGHVSFSRRNRMPSYDDLKTVLETFCDLDHVTLQIFPKRAEYVNCHPYCLHLWQPIGFDPVADPNGERWRAVGGGIVRPNF